jgi:peptidoglycan-associated lipoprotein
MMNRMFRGLSLALALTLVLAGCSSVKLDDVPVEDKSASSTAGQPGAGGAAAATESRVAPVAADSAAGTAAGPANVARILYFDYDSYVIKPEFQSLIEGHARFLKANSGRRVAIEGHTDERGGREYNLALGQRRSEAVRRALALLGVPDSQMEAVSFGKEKPAAPGSDEAAWSRNRRAELVYR